MMELVLDPKGFLCPRPFQYRAWRSNWAPRDTLTGHYTVSFHSLPFNWRRWWERSTFLPAINASSSLLCSLVRDFLSTHHLACFDYYTSSISCFPSTLL